MNSSSIWRSKRFFNIRLWYASGTATRHFSSLPDHDIKGIIDSESTSDEHRVAKSLAPKPSKRQSEFKDKFKRLISKYGDGSNIKSFIHQTKFLHESNNHNLSKLLISASVPKLHRDMTYGNKVEWDDEDIKQCAFQHARFIEIQARLEYSETRFDSLGIDEVKYCLRNDHSLRFLMNKWAIKRKEASRKKATQSSGNKTSDSPTSAYLVAERSIIPFISIEQQYKNSLHWKLMSGVPIDMPIILDMSFDSLMKRSAFHDMISQIHYIFSFNKSQRDPLPIMFANMKPDSQSYSMMKDVYGFPDGYAETTPHNILEIDGILKEDLIYLTPDAREEVEQYQPDKAYVIGALVDKSVGNNTTHKLAKRVGVNQQKLPLKKYLVWGNKGGRLELSLDIVFKILHTLRRTGNWCFALQHVPRRFHRGLTEIGKREAGDNEEILDWYTNPYPESSQKYFNTVYGTEQKYLGWKK